MPARRIQTWRPILAGLALVALAASLFSLLDLTFSKVVQFDATFIYAAGKMWAAGADPYGPEFAKWGGGLPLDAIWAYPPQWWAIARGLALFAPDTAYLVWKLINLAALAAGSCLLLMTAGKSSARPAFAAVIAFIFLMGQSDPVRSAFDLGQTSVLILLGFALLVRGHQIESSLYKTSGLVLLLLKPQIGLFFVAIALARPELRRAAVAAVAITILLCLPLLTDFGVRGTIASANGLLDNIAIYPTLKWNRPLEVAGLAFLFAVIGGGTISSIACIVAAAGSCLHVLRRSERTEDLWIVSLSCALFFLPLHGYDFVVGASLLLLIREYESWGRICVCTGLLLIWQTPAISSRFHYPVVPDGEVGSATVAYIAVYTMAALLFFVSAVWARRAGKATGRAGILPRRESKQACESSC